MRTSASSCGWTTRLGRLVRASRARCSRSSSAVAVVAVDDRRASRRAARSGRRAPTTMAGRFSAQMSSQMSGWPLATRVMSRNPPAARRSSAACSSARSAARPIRRRRGEVRHVADHGDHLVVALGRHRHDLGAELGDHAPRPWRTWRRRCRRTGVSTQTAPLNIVAVGAVEPVELAAGHRVAADEAGIVDGAAIAPFTLPTSVTTPVVSASARLTWSATASTGTATNVIAGVGVEAGGVDARRARRRRSAATGSMSSPLTCQPGSRRASAIDPPISPRPITLARRWLESSRSRSRS